MLQPNRDTTTFYFPAATVNDFLNSWYSKMLRALGEPVLYSPYSENKELYRFTWLRTFHNPIVLRMEKEGERITLTVKVSSGQGGYEPGMLVTDTTINLTLSQWNEFEDRINMVNFWEMPYEDRKSGMDGAEWILEGISGTKYHFTTKWSPDLKHKEYRECCELLIRFSKIKIPKRLLY